jgi:hypothetical protein
VITSRPTVRSKRRQASFALFGRPVQPIKVEVALERSPSSADGLDDATSIAKAHDERADGGRRQNDFEAMLARLQREAESDQRLNTMIASAELTALIEETARALWLTSRVKTFVPLLVMRRVYESLGLDDEAQEETRLTSRLG